MVRLVAPTTLVQQRLHGRDNGATLERHLRTLTEQEALFDEMRLEDFTVVNDRSYDDVAREIASRAGWLDPT